MPIRKAGIGLPDWVRETKFPTILSPKQKEWSVLIEFKKTPETDNRIPPFSIASAEVYTVPEGYRLLMKGAVISATDEANMPMNIYNKAWIVITTPGVVGDRYYFMTDALTFVPSHEIKEKHSIYLYIHNFSGELMTATATFLGVLESLR